MNCQTFATGLSSGDFSGRARMVMLAGTTNLADRCRISCFRTAVSIKAKTESAASVELAGAFVVAAGINAGINMD